jgi:hypothetical protein
MFERTRRQSDDSRRSSLSIKQAHDIRSTLRFSDRMEMTYWVSYCPEQYFLFGDKSQCGSAQYEDMLWP